jgi:hypothetical protein
LVSIGFANYVASVRPLSTLIKILLKSLKINTNLSRIKLKELFEKIPPMASKE